MEDPEYKPEQVKALIDLHRRANIKYREIWEYKYMPGETDLVHTCLGTKDEVINSYQRAITEDKHYWIGRPKRIK